MPANFMQSGQVEAGRGFVQQQRRWVMNQRPSDEQPAGLAGRELVRPALGQMQSVQPRHCGPRCFFHLGQHVVVRPDADGTEKPGKHQLTAGDVARALGHQIVADDPEMRAQLEDIPISAAQNAQPCAGPEERIALARDGLDERRFPAAIRAQNSHVLAAFDPKAQAVQSQPIAAAYKYVFELQQRNRQNKTEGIRSLAITARQVKELAQACGFELAGVAPALPSEDFARFEDWRAAGLAGEMTYMTDRRGDLRADPRNLLPSARSIVCVGKLYNRPHPHTAELHDQSRGWISRYAWGADYHDVLRRGLEALVKRMAELSPEPFEWKICVDTSPLLERSYARAAGLGWIGKNSCLINQQQGSWFFLGELLLSIPLAPDLPPPNRCGTCTRCIDACPTTAIVSDGEGGCKLDARLCISYLTIEKRGEIPPELAGRIGNHIFGCDICQDVCPWNAHAPATGDVEFAPGQFAPELEELAALSEEEFRRRFRRTPVWRAKYAGFRRNVANALHNTRTADP
jgi:epoxyqueuosine reductase